MDMDAISICWFSKVPTFLRQSHSFTTEDELYDMLFDNSIKAKCSRSYEPRRKKPGFRVFRPGPA